MLVYADTSFLMAAYSPEPESMRVLAWLQSARHPLPFTPLHRLEVRNAIPLRVFRGEITPEQRQQAFQEIESDLAGAVLEHIAVPWIDTLREAEALAAGHAERLGVRSMGHFSTSDSRSPSDPLSSSVSTTGRLRWLKPPA